MESQALEKLKKISELESGWKFGQGVEFPRKTIENTYLLISYLESKNFEVEIFPSVNGYILLIIYKDNKSLECCCKEDFVIIEDENSVEETYTYGKFLELIFLYEEIFNSKFEKEILP